MEILEMVLEEQLKQFFIEEGLSKSFVSLVKEVKNKDNDYLGDMPNYIGRGCARYVFSLNEDYVLKYQKNITVFCGGNREEYNLYQSLKKEKNSFIKYFAEPVFISKDGKFLIMEKMEMTMEDVNRGDSEDRTEILEENQKIVSILEEKFGIKDLHSENTMINKYKKIKVVDYAYLINEDSDSWYS